MVQNLAKHLCNSILIIGVVFYLIYILFPYNYSYYYTFTIFFANLFSRSPVTFPFDHSATNISHIAFGIASSTQNWPTKKAYTQAWWKPPNNNNTKSVVRGYVFLERIPPLSTTSYGSSVQFLAYKNTSNYAPYDKHPIPQTIRMTRMIVELFEAINEGVRWYVMSDDDTVFFVGNLVEVLGKYDHNKYFYIGMNSETFSANNFHSFDMAFGGGGYVLSSSLAKAVVANLDVCIKRYQTLYGSDHMVQSCVADLGVSLTPEKGFHQVILSSLSIFMVNYFCRI